MEKRNYRGIGHKHTKTSVKKYTYLLTELLFCTHCGCRFGGHLKKTQTSYYECVQKTGKFKNTQTDRYIDCGTNRNLRIDTTDQVIWDTMVDVLSNSHLFKERVKQETLGGRFLHQSTSDIKKIQKGIARVSNDIAKVTNSIINLNTKRLIGNLGHQDLEKVINNFEKHRLKLETYKEDLAREMQQETQNRVWIDWLKEFGKRIDDLRDPSLTIEEKKRFLEGVVDWIEVKSVDKQTHEFKIGFTFPYVGDTLVKETKRGKSRKTSVKGGSRTKRVRVNLLMKLGSYQGESVFIQ